MYSKILRLSFPKTLVDRPLVCDLVRRFDLTFNIYQATVFPRKEGQVVIELSGLHKNFQEGIKYLKEVGVKVETVEQDVRRDEETCFHCGLCTSLCPTGALFVKRPEMEVVFEPNLCNACELCMSVCPPRAMRVTYNSDSALL
ncbi:MAG: 4Fe-4S binding protein [Deltaproteobacteria bacterium]|nr:4Fe-4S binding protein [Deltaproteobacteria bacterium]